MTTTEFNKKYKDYLVEGHYGLDTGDSDFIDWLDTRFQEFIKIPDFKYMQIKAKFNMGRFYCEGPTPEQIYEVESRITQLYSKPDKGDNK